MNRHKYKKKIVYQFKIGDEVKHNSLEYEGVIKDFTTIRKVYSPWKGRCEVGNHHDDPWYEIEWTKYKGSVVSVQGFEPEKVLHLI